MPRRGTEFRVAALVPPGVVVVDLCCGSGAVGAAASAAVDGVRLHAVDVDPAAVRRARRNFPGAQVYEGDHYTPLPDGLRWLAPGGHVVIETSSSRCPSPPRPSPVQGWRRGRRPTGRPPS